MNSLLILEMFVILLIILMLIHLYFRRQTFNSIDQELQKVNLQKMSKKEYLDYCYHLVSDRYVWGCQTWIIFPWRNFFYRNFWNLSGKNIPCHLQNRIFQHCLLKKFARSEVKTPFINDPKQFILVHFYSKVKVDGKWVDVDVHQKKRGLPFGKNILAFNHQKKNEVDR